MLENIFVSIVVPVYKVEKYLHQCVTSIISQTYKKYELILVDDGSPDNCPQICDDYAKKYENIISLHKPNGGLSDARNYGVQRAKGTHITFVDSDDYIAPEYLSELVKLIVYYHADMSVINREKVFEGKKNKKGYKENIKRECLGGKEALERVLYQKGMDTNAWGILAPLSLVKEIPFPVGKYHEDERTTYKYYLVCKHVAISNRKLYFYLQREESIMHTIFGKASIDELDAADLLVQAIKKECPTLSNAAESKKFSDYCQVLLSNPNLQSIDEKSYQRIIKYIMSVRGKIIFNSNTRIKNKMAAFSLLFGPKGLYFVDKIIKHKGR